MRRYPPSTIHRYLDLPSKQRIQTRTPHRHNITPPLQTLVQAPYQLPTYTTHTTATKTQTHVQHSPCSYRIGKVETQSSHPLTPPLHPTRPEPNTYTSHILHQLLTSHAPHSSITRQLRSTPYLNHVYHPHVPYSPHLIHPPHQHCCQHHTITHPQQTHMQHKQRYTNHSHSNHLIHIGYHDQRTDSPKTTI